VSAFLLLAAALSMPAQPGASQQTRPPTYAIAGAVVDFATGNPVRRAKISLSYANDETSLTADDHGLFRFEGLQPGKYQIYASAPGYVGEGLNQHGGFFTAVVVGAGLDSEHVLFRIHPQAVIHGRVTDERGEPVRHASVTLYAADGHGTQRHILIRSGEQTDGLGEFRFAHLPAGSYFVAVQCNPWYAQTSFRFATRVVDNGAVFQRNFTRDYLQKPDPTLDVVFPVTFYPGVTDEHSASPLNLSPGDTQEADIPMRAVPAVHLRVTNLPLQDNGMPTISAVQKVFGAMSVGLPTAMTQISPGEFEIAGLPPTDVTLLLNGNEPDKPSRTLEASVTDGATLDTSRVGPAVTIFGRVILPPGSGEIGQAGLMLMRDGNSNPFVRLKKDGSFSVAPVEAGSYRLRVDLSGTQQFIQKVSASGARLNGRELIINGGNDVQLTIVIAEGVGQITGFASLEGHSAAGVMVLLVPESGLDLDDDSRQDQSDSDGSFTLASIAPGKYRLLAIADGWSLDWRDPAVLKPYLAKAQSLQMGSGDERKLIVEVLPLIK
jgi:hypothetical protein